MDRVRPRGHAFVLASITILFLVLLAGRASAQDARPAYGGVIDFARVFGAEDRRGLEVVAGRIARHMNVDFFIASVDDRARHWAWRFETNRAMVERVFADVRTAAIRHFGGSKDLAVLLVFKTQPVLHLKTDNKVLERTLLFNNFYSGAKGAYDRVRDPRRESHHDAAMRYLETFARTVAPTGMPSPVQEAGYWLLDEYALLKSRNVIEMPLLEPAFALFRQAVHWVIDHTGWPGAAVFLGLFALAHIVVAFLVEVVPDRIGALVQHRRGLVAGFMAGKGADTVFEWGWLVAMVPLLVVVFSISYGDLENIVYLTQAVGGGDLGRAAGASGKSDIVTYLEWSEAITSFMGELPHWVLALALAGVLYLEVQLFRRSAGARFGEVLARASGSMRWMKMALAVLMQLVSSGSKFVKAVVFVISLVIFPGVVQLYFIVSALAIRATVLWLQPLPVGAPGSRKRAAARAPGSRLAPLPSPSIAQPRGAATMQSGAR